MKDQMRGSVEPELEQTDVAIVGGGMVGMSLAAMLAKLCPTLHVTLIEAQVPGAATTDSSTFDARSTAIAAGSVRMFEQLGLWRKLAAEATPIHEVQVSDRGQVGWAKYSTEANHGEPLGYIVENTWLLNTLRRWVGTLDTLSYKAPVAVQSIVHTAAGAILNLSCDGVQSKLQAQLVVLADGANSPIAKSIGIAFDQHKYGQCAIVANVAHETPHMGRAFERFTERGPLALLPLRDHRQKHRSALVWTRTDSEANDHLAMSEQRFIEALQHEFGYALGKFLAVGERSAFSLNLLFAREQVRSSLVLIGNAAHFLHPVAGQGFNLALRDCAELAQQLLDAHRKGKRLGDLTVLDAYLDARKQDQWLTTQLSHRFIDMFVSTHIAKRFARNLGLFAMNQQTPLKSLFFQQMMGLGGRGEQLS